MRPEDVAERFDNRPGYRIVDYGLVGLPVFKVTAVGLTLVTKDIAPIEEFILRAVGAGLRRVSDVSGLLGLSERVTTEVLTVMFQREVIGLKGEGGDTELQLTDKGKSVLEEHSETRPVEQTVPFTFDGLLRRPCWYGDLELLSPKELRNREIPEVRAYPDRGPELHELKISEVADTLAIAAGKPGQAPTLLRIHGIERRSRRYHEAVALAYRSTDGPDVQVAFAIDGRLSEPHELAFADSKVFSRNPLFRGVGHGPPPEEALAELDNDLLQKASDSRATEVQEKLARARREMVEARVGFEEARDTADHQLAEGAVAAAEEELSHVLHMRDSAVVRPLEVYEHADILDDALKGAKERLLIVSPWIRAGVVNEEFLRKLTALLKKGVAVAIGFGLGDGDSEERPLDKGAREQLEALGASYENCLIRRLGDTHAKVLIKDREYYVITSFNWLSFRGDRRRPFREELGALVRLPQRVEELYSRMIARLTPDR